MSNSDQTDAIAAVSTRMIALEMLLFALADTCPDRTALRKAFDFYSAGIEAKLNALPMHEHQLDLLRESLAEVRAGIGRGVEDERK